MLFSLMPNRSCNNAVSQTRSHWVIRWVLASAFLTGWTWLIIHFGGWTWRQGFLFWLCYGLMRLAARRRV